MNLDIVHLLNYKEFVSGELISKKLNISRTAVWKKIQLLKELGYDIESVKNKGYRLISKPDVTLSEEITFNLDTKIIGKKIIYFNSISSTNSYAKNLIKKNAEEGTVIISDVQTNGRGRKNRNWLSPKEGLWFSVLLYPKIPAQYAMYVTMAASISVVQAINKLTSLLPIIKWPNDLLLEGKKICGILTELDAEIDRINYCIVGIGINVNNYLDKELIEKAGSIIDFYNSKISRVELLKLFLYYFDINYLKLISKNFDYIKDLWLSYADILDKKVRIIGEKNIITGLIVDIDDTGCLIINTNDKKIKVVSGDLEFI
jgi:BirA family biotin operon repressor/biotin-[acetyl-CoA-carboxylase] ligase